MEVVINEQNFSEEVENSKIPVLVDFWATWCGPCRMLSPVIEEIAKEYDGKIKVGKVNVDEAMGLAIRYEVDTIPTLIMFKDGKVEKRTVGYYEKEEVIKNFSL